MAVTATNDEKKALEKFLGAADNASDAYGYIGEALGELDKLRDKDMFPAGWGSKLADRAGLAQKAYNYTRLVFDTFDEKTRSGGILKLGLEVALEVGSKFLGRSLSTHPYYTYHKVMIDALADTLNASRNAKAAVESYRRAVNAAQSEGLANAFRLIERRKTDVGGGFIYVRKELGFVSDLRRGLMSPAFARKKIAELGQSNIERAVQQMSQFRAVWAGIVFDCLTLQLLAASEVKAAAVATAKAGELIDGLMKGGSVSVVGGQSARNMIEWEKYDRVVRQKAPQKATMDPVGFAEDALSKATAYVNAFAAMLDFVLSNDAHRDNAYNAQLDKLNKVLYG